MNSLTNSGIVPNKNRYQRSIDSIASAMVGNGNIGITNPTPGPSSAASSLLSSNTQQAQQQISPFKMTIIAESIDRIKEEFSFLQSQYNNLKVECEKLAQEKSEIQRQYVMYYEMSYGLNVEMHKQSEIVKRLSAIVGQVMPFLSQEHQSQVATAVERAKHVTVAELNSVLGTQHASSTLTNNNVNPPRPSTSSSTSSNNVGGSTSSAIQSSSSTAQDLARFMQMHAAAATAQNGVVGGGSATPIPGPSGLNNNSNGPNVSGLSSSSNSMAAVVQRALASSSPCLSAVVPSSSGSNGAQMNGNSLMTSSSASNTSTTASASSSSAAAANSMMNAMIAAASAAGLPPSSTLSLLAGLPPAALAALSTAAGGAPSPGGLPSLPNFNNGTSPGPSTSHASSSSTTNGNNQMSPSMFANIVNQAAQVEIMKNGASGSSWLPHNGASTSKSKSIAEVMSAALNNNPLLQDLSASLLAGVMSGGNANSSAANKKLQELRNSLASASPNMAAITGSTSNGGRASTDDSKSSNHESRVQIQRS